MIYKVRTDYVAVHYHRIEADSINEAEEIALELADEEPTPNDYYLYDQETEESKDQDSEPDNED